MPKWKIAKGLPDITLIEPLSTVLRVSVMEPISDERTFYPPFIICEAMLCLIYAKYSLTRHTHQQTSFAFIVDNCMMLGDFEVL